MYSHKIDNYSQQIPYKRSRCAVDSAAVLARCIFYSFGSAGRGYLYGRVYSLIFARMLRIVSTVQLWGE